MDPSYSPATASIPALEHCPRCTARTRRRNNVFQSICTRGNLWYPQRLVETNPSSITRLDVTAENQFQRVFICYGACAVGFAHCRPLLGLDGTHIKTRYQGIILAATGIDALGQLFPLAYAVVDAENKENWRWMLQLIRRVLEQSAPQFLEAKVSLYFYSI